MALTIRFLSLMEMSIIVFPPYVVAVVPVRIYNIDVCNLLFVAIWAEVKSFLDRFFIALPTNAVLTSRIIGGSDACLIIALLRSAFGTEFETFIG
jgi:hypothetical protein